MKVWPSCQFRLRTCQLSGVESPRQKYLTTLTKASAMIREAHVSLQSFLLGLGILSYYILIAVRGCFLGAACGSGVMVSALLPLSYHVFGWYVVVLTVFHYSEYLTTALGNPKTLSLDSYLLNHSLAYGIAAAASWAEFFTERWLFPEMKQLWVISIAGIIICLWGEVMRKSAMLTAKTNFNHIVQIKRQQNHELVTWGAYQLFRHPSYVGWFWWSIGTQIILVNPFCMLAYALASWKFFSDRINFEEMTLIHFFGEKYIEYQKKVGTGLPFIKGYTGPRPPLGRSVDD